MKVGIISDTHNRLNSIDKAFTVFINQQVGLIIHAGDWTTPQTIEYFAELARAAGIPVQSVLGNNDRYLPSEYLRNTSICFYKDFLVAISIDGKNIAISHGDNRALANQAIDSQKFDLVILGHTHKLKQFRKGKTLVFNPGSAAYSVPRKKNMRYVGIYDTQTNQVQSIPLLHD